jgi:signal recognition particle subunit SRP54
MQKIEYPLIVSDFDGTLVRADGTVSLETKQTIRQYIQDGGKFAISTGRMPKSISSQAKELGLTGVVLTKLDGDTRGGAALSVRYVTGKPIKFIGVGEKMDAIEPFHPDRMSSRILGMGDVLSLIEKAEAAYDDKKAAELERKMREQTFTLDDYLEQFEQIRNMGSMEQLLGMMPGVNTSALKDAQIDEKAMGRVEAIIKSMTPKERAKPDILNSSRKRRIAAGSGTSVEEVNRLLKQFEQVKKLMKQFASMGGKRRGKMMKFPF